MRLASQRIQWYGLSHHLIELIDPPEAGCRAPTTDASTDPGSPVGDRSTRRRLGPVAAWARTASSITEMFIT